MANTFNLGNGNWAQKTEKLLAYNAENDNYKPLPFDFDRASTATRVNKQGLIETVATDEPRIDFLNNSKGHLLLEPSRQNLVTYSEDLSNSSWTKSQSSVTLSNITSPKGTQNVYKFTENTATSKHQLFRTISSYTELTISFFAKKEERSFIAVEKSGWGSTIFDLNTGSVVSGTGNVIDFGNGWFRCSASYTASPAQTQFYLLLMQDSSTNNYQGDGNSGLYLWGIQAEAGSYATSYIPTSGSAVTRSAETCNGAGNSTVFNDSEGVLYMEMAALDDDGTNRIFGISDGGDFNNSVLLRFSSSSNRIQAQVRLGGVYQCSLNYDVSDATEFNKIAFKYKQNDFSLYVNGVERATDTTGNVITGLDVLDFDISTTNEFYGKTKELAVFKEALTDAELESLTSWISFTEMATDLEYTLE